MCPEDFATQFGLNRIETKYELKSVSCQVVKHYGERNVPILLTDNNGSTQNASMKLVVAGVTRRVLGMGEVMRRGFGLILNDGRGWLCRGDRWVLLEKNGSGFFAGGGRRRQARHE